jgi:hypothetical protein
VKAICVRSARVTIFLGLGGEASSAAGFCHHDPRRNNIPVTERGTLMKSFLRIVLLTSLAITLQLVAQDTLQPQSKHKQYKLYDVGTFGGPNSYGSYQAISLTTAGAIGLADTAVPDPFSPNCFLNCVVEHALLWRKGVTTDLGALPGNNSGNSAYAFAINQSGLVVGISKNGAIDPDTGFPSTSPVVWLNGQIFNLGGFGGTQGAAYMVNNRGQIVG